MAYPTSTKDVSTLVVFCQENSLDMAVCGGRHSVNSASSTVGGLCIDLAQMRDVSVDPSTNRVTVQGSAIWTDVYTVAEKYDLGLVGGICGTVGVGGSGLMGGYGWLTGAHGLSIDNLIEAEIVLADGRVLIASSSENPELYWAIRGAGPCFGVATSITFQGHVQGLAWTGQLVFPASDLAAVVEFTNHVLEVSKGESSVLMYWGRFPGREPGILAEVFYNGEEREAKEFFAPLLNLGPIRNTTAMKTFSETVSNGEKLPPEFMTEQTGGGIMEPFDLEFLESIFKDLLDFAEKVPDAGQSLVAYESHPMYGTLQHSQTETAYPNRGKYANFALVAIYTKEENRPACIEWCRTMHDKVHKEFERRKLVDDVDEVTKTGVGEYINYDGECI